MERVDKGYRLEIAGRKGLESDMLKFQVYEHDGGEPLALRNAHMVGADAIGVRGTIKIEGDMIVCQKRTSGPVALSLQHEVEDVGAVTLQTCLLPDRSEPYVLSLELARHRLMLLLSKQEDWMMFDMSHDHPAMKRAKVAKQLFVRALAKLPDDREEASRLGLECLRSAVDASEELALAHADILYKRRLSAGQFHRGVFGCGVGVRQQSETVRASLLANFDYLSLPMPWRQIEPQEQKHDWSSLDSWGEWAYRNRMPILAGPLIGFEDGMSPDWLGVLEHDYETLRDVLYEHIERVVTRYRNVVTLWNVVSGLHTNSAFDLMLDQLMDLTRMAVLLIKKVQPNAKTLVEVTQPFGEYYSQNPKSIPPLIYADMVLQAGIPVDAFGVRLMMGQSGGGQHTRDLMQVSAMLDRFNGLGKPVHVTGVAVPSDVAKSKGDGTGSGCGYWRKPWTAVVQSHWLEAFYHIALSKPYIDSVAWLDLADHEDSLMAHGGLAMSDLKAKGAFHRITALRKSLHAESAASRNPDAAS